MKTQVNHIGMAKGALAALLTGDVADAKTRLVIAIDRMIKEEEEEEGDAYLARYGRDDTADSIALRNRLCPVLPAPEADCPDHKAIAADADGRANLIEEVGK